MESFVELLVASLIGATLALSGNLFLEKHKHKLKIRERVVEKKLETIMFIYQEMYLLHEKHLVFL